MSKTVDYASVVDVHRVMASIYGSPIDVGISDVVGTLRAAEDVLPSILDELRSPAATYSADQVRALLVAPLSLKKWRLPVGASNLDAVAIEGFVERNGACTDRNSVPHTIRARMRELLRHWLPPVRYAPLPRLGPGAVAERYSYLKKRERLLEATLYFRELFALHTERGTFADHDCSRLCAVPKDWNKKRLITVEPYFNTLVQQAARSYIWECFLHGPFPWRYVRKGTVRVRVPRYEWLHFWDRMPAHQRAMALRGSQDPEWCTIDLKDASDGISYDLVSDVFPAHVMAWIDVSRTPYFAVNGEPQKLNIYAGMGNATTFIVETLLFLAFATACQQQSGVRSHPITVFGDDIVCSTELYREMSKIDTGSFFRINHDKSFVGDAPFRESCGTFAYRGQDLGIFRYRGYSQSAEGLEALCDLWRGLASSHYRSDRAFAGFIADNSTLPNLEYLPPGYPAVRTYGRPFDAQKLRWNWDLQRLETLVPLRVPGHHSLKATESWMIPASNIEAIRTTEDWFHGRVRRRVHVPSGRVRTTQQWLACH